MENKKHNSIGALLSVGITTKGRLSELRETLNILEKSELVACNIILIDDGGSGEFIEENDYELDLSIHRYRESEGLVARRNELATLCQTKYIMSLDDDSAPEVGSVLDVIHLLENDDRVASVALNLYNDDTQPNNTDSDYFESRYFVGCGHIHDVVVFKELGGYNSDLIYGHEEREYAFKLAKASKTIVHVNNYVVKHRRSHINREIGYNPRMAYNLGWINGTYLGLFANLVELYSFLKGRDTKTAKPAVLDYFKGYKQRNCVNKLSPLQYRIWKRMKTPTIA